MVGLVRPVVAVCATLCLAVSGCGSSGGGAGDRGSGQGTVKMTLWPGPEGEAMQKVVEAYHAGKGGSDGVKVEMILLSRTDTFAKEATMMSAKSADVDLYFTASYIVGQHAASLDPLGELGTADYFPVAVDGLKADGKQYGLPLDVSNHFLYYRKDLVDQLLTDPGWQASYRRVSAAVLGKELAPKPPPDWDWDDYLAAAAFFTQQHNPDSPTKYGTALQAKNLLFNVMIWNDVLWSYGGNWIGPDSKPALTSDAAKNAMRVYSTAYTKGLTSPDSAQAEFAETQAALQAGSAAFAVQWSAGYAELNDPGRSPKIAGKLAIAPVPGKPHKTHVHALAVGMNKYGKNKDAATKWLNYLATPEAMTAYAQAGGIPAMPKVLAANAAKNPVFAKVADSISQYGYAAPTLRSSYEIYGKLAESLSAGWVGTRSIDEALAEAQAKIAPLVTR